MFRKIIFVIFGVVLSLMVTLSALAAAPAEGVVVEGQSVPGIALGDTRAEVVSAIGQPKSCSSVDELGDYASCEFDVDGGGKVWVRYRGPDGGNASNSPDDIVRNISWYNVEGWVTTAGINTTVALENPQAVIDAYPNAEVTYYYGDYVAVVWDPEMGIRVRRTWNFYGAFTTVTMSISSPYTPPPPQDKIRVADIEMTADRHSVTARVLVLDDQDQPVEGAVVDATWTYPNGDSLKVSGATASDGYTTFRIDKARRGVYYLYINEVTADGYVYDLINTTTTGVILKNK
ncbi:MAG: hypothetical protein ACYS32_19550 [Planctomycetota bacterium]|jgi:hypothetical protein